MTYDEVISWIQHTADRFPGLALLVNDAEDKCSLARSWASVLENVPLSGAEDYTQAMLNGNPEPPTFKGDWGTLPARVRRWYSDNKPVALRSSLFTPDERQFNCLACMDRGYGVEIFSPNWILHHRTEIELGELTGDWQSEARKWCRARGLKLTGCVLCSCTKGRERAERKGTKEMMYWPGFHCIVPGGGQGVWMETLRQWVMEHPLEQTNSWSHSSGYLENKS